MTPGRQSMIRAHLPSRRALAFTVALGLAAAGVGAVRTTTTAEAALRCSQPTAITSAIFNLTNGSRAAAFVRPLRWNGALACLAKRWSAYMARTGVLRH